jgi:hypothetical protein
VLLTKYYSTDIKVDEMGGPCGTHGEKTTAHKVLMGKDREKRSQGIPRH